MVECRHCRELINLEGAGARCPLCRMPLYERAEIPRQKAGRRHQQTKVCAVHANNVAVGSCERCGAEMCGACRSEWYECKWCTACVERALANDEPPPAETAGHRRLAWLGLGLSLSGWLFAVLAVLILFVPGDGKESGAIAGIFLLCGSLLPAVFALGSASAAVRVRGNRMIPATAGLVLSSSQLGILLGLLLLNIWHL